MILGGRTGFDLESNVKLQAENDGWSLKTPVAKSNAKNIDTEMAPSLAEADEILAKFGYTEDEALLLAV